MSKPSLKATRATLQRSFRYLKKYHDEAESKIQEHETEGAEPDICQFEATLDLLQAKIKEFEVTMVNFEQRSVDENDDSYCQDLEMWSSQVFASQNLTAKGRRLCTMIRQDQASSRAEPETDSTLNESVARVLSMMEERIQGQSSSNIQRDRNGNTVIQARLPKLELPKFHGDVLKWKPFFDRFEASVDNNSKLALVDKMSYLLSQLGGEAYKLVESLPVTNENYTVALALLKSKYEDTRMVVSLMYRKLSELPKVKGDVTAMRNFVTELDSILGSLDALGQDTNDDSFSSIIFSKMPSSVVMQLELAKDVKIPWTVKLLREKMTEYLIRAERAAKVSADKGQDVFASTERKTTADTLIAGDKLESSYSGKMQRSTGQYNNNYKRVQSRFEPKDHKWQSAQRASPTRNLKLDQPMIKTCAFCQGSHFSDECRRYESLESRYAKLGRKCRNCLKEGHFAYNCQRSKPCFHCKKVKTHHAALCPQRFGNRERRKKEPSHVAAECDESTQQALENSTALLASNEEVMLQTAMVPVSAQVKGQYVSERALLDPGANRTYVSVDLAKKLALKMEEGPSLTVNRFGAGEPIQVRTKAAKINLKTLSGRIVTIDVSVVPKITGEIRRSSCELSKLKELQSRMILADVPPRRAKSSPIDMLIGNDYYLDFVTGEKIEVEKGLYLLGSEFGYILTGRLPMQRSDEGISMLIIEQPHYKIEMIGNEEVQIPSNQDIEGLNLASYWSMEGLGLRDDNTGSSDEEAIRNFEANVRYKANRYSVSLPFNSKREELNSHYKLSEGRLKALVRKLKEKPELFKKYQEIMEDQERKGIIEKVNEDERAGQTHYIPHHAVITPQKETTKVRVVYDGSAKLRDNSPSLNECLHRGPVMLEDMAGLLLRFRMNPIAIAADIEKAFLQIGINEEDRNLVRFLWIKDSNKGEANDNVQIMRFCRVLFGLNCSPALLAQTIAHHLKKTNTAVAKRILQDLYVDNVLSGVMTAEEGKKFYYEAKEIFKNASMNLREWMSSSKEVIRSIPEIDQAKGKVVKILGVKWQPETDKFSISGVKLTEAEATTRRSILSQVSSVFDPLGWFSPCLVVAKSFLQEVTESKLSWDATLPTERIKQWEEAKTDLKRIDKVEISRFVPKGEISKLVVFSDASAKCLAAVVYLWSQSGQIVQVNLLMAKCRLNPVKRLTIPRAELTAILIGTRLATFVKKHLKTEISDIIMLSDSQSALSWLKSDKPMNGFVKNRVKEICEKQPNMECRYVPTDENPADWATRGKKSEELSDFWWKGPAWLWKTQPTWPNSEIKPFKPKLTEVKQKIVHEASLVVVEKEYNPPFGISIERFSSLTKLLRVTARCQIFIERLKVKEPDKRSNKVASKDLDDARESWVKYVQGTCYSFIRRAAEKGHSHAMSKLGLLVDSQGQLRCQGRLAKSEMEWSAKFPILLPAHHRFTHLVVEAIHTKNGHVSVSHTLSLLRQKYWVPKGRALVKKILHWCTVCRKAAGQTYQIPKMPELPKSRVTPCPSFHSCGVDYFGPVKLKSKNGVEKAWVCLFTCLTTRAIHLELVDDLSADGFLMAIRRFIARRGKPSQMLSDNGPQFKLVSQVWNDVTCEDNRISNYCTNHGIAWRFITEFVPYMGGVYERMIGTVKSSLRKTIGKTLLSPTRFRTLLRECEGVVNSRPLTYVPSDDPEPEVLTPAHFLNPLKSTLIPTISIPGQVQTTSTGQDLIDIWRKGQNLLNEFWRQWSNDYLNSLRERNTYYHRHSSRNAVFPNTGHLVLIKEANAARGSWKIGRIMTLDQSEDGQCRSATVRLVSGLTLHRPVNMLIPFEMPPQQGPDERETKNSKEFAVQPRSAIDETRQQDKVRNQAEDALKTRQAEKSGKKVILAKLRGYPKWPATVLSDVKNTPLEVLKMPKHSVPIQFLETEKFAFVPKSQISDFEKESKPESSNKRLIKAFKLARTTMVGRGQ